MRLATDIFFVPLQTSYLYHNRDPKCAIIHIRSAIIHPDLVRSRRPNLVCPHTLWTPGEPEPRPDRALADMVADAIALREKKGEFVTKDEVLELRACAMVQLLTAEDKMRLFTSASDASQVPCSVTVTVTVTATVTVTFVIMSRP